MPAMPYEKFTKVLADYTAEQVVSDAQEPDCYTVETVTEWNSTRHLSPLLYLTRAEADQAAVKTREIYAESNVPATITVIALAAIPF